MRRAFLVAAILLTACSGSSASAAAPTPSSATTTATGSPTLTPTSTPSTTPSPSSEPVHLPKGTPGSYRPDDEPGDVPAASLVPADATVTGTWFADARGGQTILVAFQRGSDPFASEHALLAWRRFGDVPHWRPVIAVDAPPSAGVLGITVTLGDATGDRSTDALAFESMGGSGACGTWRLLDLALATDVWDLESACDTTVAFTKEPVGLKTTEAVFKAGDSHCCPSKYRISQLEFEGTTMAVTSRTTKTSPIAP